MQRFEAAREALQDPRASRIRRLAAISTKRKTCNKSNP